MAWKSFQRIDFDYEVGHAKPYVITAWCNVGGVECGDRFTYEVGEIFMDGLRLAEITYTVRVRKPAKKARAKR